MAQILVRNIDDSTKQAIKARAKATGRSMEAEVRKILEAAVADQAESGGLGTRMAARFADFDFTEEIAELRGEEILGVEFDP